MFATISNKVLCPYEDAEDPSMVQNDVKRISQEVAVSEFDFAYQSVEAADKTYCHRRTDLLLPLSTDLLGV